MSLLNKIVNSSIAENKTNRRLHEMSYSAINGQRQEAKSYQPEGVVMLGQMNRERPLPAITKEMIQEFQEKEKAPIMVDGEARVYNKPDFEPLMQIPTETQDIEDEGAIILRNRILTARNLQEAINNYMLILQNIKALETDINVFGSNAKKQQELQSLKRQKEEYLNITNDLKKDYETYTYELNRRRELIKDINKRNALIQQQNQEEVKQYELALQQVNKNRLNLQQQPYESEMDYYRRLKEVEQTKYDPILYKQYALNQNTKELKSKLPNLFKDASFIEDVMKSLSDEDKFQVNKYFDEIEKAFINKYGYNPSMSVKIASKELPAILNDLNVKTSILQAAFKRKQPREEFSKEKEAANILRGVIKRNKIQKRFTPVLNRYRDMMDKEAAEAAQAAQAERQQRVRERAAEAAAQEYRRRIVRQRLGDAAEAERQITEQIEARRRRAIQVAARITAAREQDERAEQEARAEQIEAISRQNERMQMLEETIAEAQARGRAAEEANIRREEARREAFARQIAATNLRLATTNLEEQMQEYRGSRQNEFQNRINASNLLKAAATRRKLQSLYNTGLTENIRPAVNTIKRAWKAQQARQAMRGAQAAQEQAAQAAQEQAAREQAAAITIQNALRNKRAIDIVSDKFVKQRVSPGLREEKINRQIYLKNLKAQQTALRGLQQGLLRQQRQQAMGISSGEEGEEAGAAATSAASTMDVTQQQLLRQRKPRSDRGQKRGPYSRQPPGRALEEREGRLEEVSPQRMRTRSVSRAERRAAARTRSQTREGRGIKSKKGKGLLGDIANNLAFNAYLNNTTGKGMKKPIRPKKRTISSEEKLKNRLRLVASQIEAGNTNPKLIVEVNDLYKKLYNIDNAYQYLSKNK
jgi:hypothetical protein